MPGAMKRVFPAKLDPTALSNLVGMRCRASVNFSVRIPKDVFSNRIAQRMSGTRGSGVPTRSGPDALARVLDGMLSEGIHARRHGTRLSSEA
jgi:hypothetical protein